MEMLLDGGLKFIQMGVQSGSQRMMDEVYDRKIKITRTKEVIHQITPYHASHNLDFLLDFIIDNPYETKEDVIKTYRYIIDLPLHVIVNVFFLAFFPGTPIYDRALKDGIIQPFDEKAFRFYIKSRVQYQRNYETFLILLERYLRQRPKWRNRVPCSLLHFLSSRAIRWLSRLFPESVYTSLSGLVQ
jgi:anaerobic magnesium-protoporphyrin IX monomethyl ester cyclase